MNVEHVMLSKALATTDAESRLYEFNARNQITLWGPDGGFIFLDIFLFPNLNLLGTHGTRTCIKRKKIHYGKFFYFWSEKCVYN